MDGDKSIDAVKLGLPAETGCTKPVKLLATLGMTTWSA